MNKRKSSCVMLLVVWLLVFLHCDQTSWAYACAVAEFVDKHSLSPTLEINTLEFPNEDVLPTGYNITIICTSNFSKANWGNHYYGQPYWIQQFFNYDYIGYCGGGDRGVDSEDSKVCTYVVQNSTEKDSGNYSCISRNQMACTVNTVYLEFKNPAPPRFKVDLPLNFNVSAGSKANLSCSASGIPRPVITWFKDGHRMPTSFVTGVKGSSGLTFQSVLRNDTGKYWCEANSSEGWNKSSVVNLAVLWRPIFLIHPESSFRHLDDGIVKVTLFCEASGFPRPVIGWLKNNLPVTNGTVMMNGSISSLVVVFSEVTEEPPKYRCLARNSLGSTHSSEATVTITKGNSIGELNHHSAHPTDGPVTSDGVPTLVWASVGAVAFLLIMAMVALVLFKWKRGKRSTYQLNKEIIKSQQEFIQLQLKENEDAIDQLRNRQSTVSESSSGGTHATTDENEVVDNEMYLQGMTIDRNWEIPQDRLLLTEERLGGGEFGIVTKGIYLRTDGNELPVAVKRLKDNTDQQQRLALISELETLIHVGRHPNIVSLVGACTFEEPLCIIIEFVAGGSLDNLLRSSRVQTKRDNPSYTNIWSRLTERELLKMASDVANGMRHLERKLCIHRDLACRNILVGSGLVTKVADFGMARDISTDGQYIKTTEGRIPWLWMSMEALRGTCTTKGDVWSFGVVLWEIVTLGKLPYRGVKGVVELHEQLQDGIRLQKPPHCSDELYNIMLQCWQKSPDDRPSFIELHEKLQEILHEETRMYINIKHVDGQETEHHEQGISV